ncbi:MAG: glycosyltransferase [Nanoarchaeota archaeon]|nr:glycosyltransferase [Nanoarchaeota archaeon]
MINQNILKKLKIHYDSLAKRRYKWIRRNKFYHKEILRYYRFLIPKHSSILELGCGTGNLIGNLFPSYGIGVDISEEMLKIAKQKYPYINFICQDIEEFSSNKKFDYIIISGTLNSVRDIQRLLQRISKMATHDTRIIINCYNQLWNPIIRLSQKSGLKMPEIIFNWLSIDDVENFFNISGYQVIKKDFFLLFPKYIPIITTIFNKFIGKLPLIRHLSLEQFVIARLNKPPENTSKLTTSVVITCRDEEGNIEGLVKRIPEMGKHTEIIFVEGHSKDNTVGKIKEMIKKYPKKDIKLLKQKGIGQGDAFRMGFDHAKGDFVCWLEADLTTPPEEISLFWDAYIKGKGDYINGSRFVYKMEKNSMPFFNYIGNRFFGNLFTAILGQRFTDTLCGFKAISKKNYLKIRNNIDHFGDFDPFGDFELIFGAIKNNLQVIEIPVHYRPREYGHSKAYGQTIKSFLKHVFLLLRMSWISFKKFKLN